MKFFSAAIFAFLIVIFSTPSDGVILERCQIAKLLVALGLPRGQMGDWVCLVLAESSGNTQAVGPPNRDGSRDYGLFQINSRYWCKEVGVGGDCNLNCNSLLHVDAGSVSVDIPCVKKIYGRHGFNAWYGWVNKCKGNPTYVDDCFMDQMGSDLYAGASYQSF